MGNNILITGGSGYLGGTLLAEWKSSDIFNYDTLYALVRSDEQAEAVKTLYSAEPVNCSLQPDDIRSLLLEHRINIVFYLIDAYKAESQVPFIQALSELKNQTGQDVHFIYTTGTKHFSALAGLDASKPLADTDPSIYDIQLGQTKKAQQNSHKELEACLDTNTRAIEADEKYGVRVYLFSPCIVYGKGLGFGNKISIQTVDVVTAFRAVGHAFRIGPEDQVWPVCHVEDCASLYISLAKAILNGENPGHGRNGYYLASSGSIHWNEIYAAVGKSLKKRNLIADASVIPVTNEMMQKAAEALNVSTTSVVVKISGSSPYVPKHGELIGWRAKYSSEHIIRNMDEEVEFILENVNDKHRGLR